MFVEERLSNGKIHLVAWNYCGFFDYHYPVSSTSAVFKSFACLLHTVHQAKFSNLIKLFTLWDIFLYLHIRRSWYQLGMCVLIVFLIFFSNFILLGGI